MNQNQIKAEEDYESFLARKEKLAHIRAPQTVAFSVKGIPQPQGRPRAFARKFGDQWQARVYNPATAEGWKGMVALAAKPYVPFPPITGAIGLTLRFTLPRPKGHYRANGELKGYAPEYHTSRGDFDNYAKAVCDCMTQIGMWVDDGQVAVAVIEKRYGQAPGCEIVIERLPDKEEPKPERSKQKELEGL